VVDEASINVVPRGLQVEFKVDGSQVTATSRQATILALLINECVTNAIEHGMAGRSHGRIDIHASEQEGMVEVTIDDDGMGIPAGFDVERDSQLGLRIARTLATSDLSGSYALEPREAGGARSTIRFPAQR
jgi:two-component sensor histidine kinase